MSNFEEGESYKTYKRRDMCEIVFGSKYKKLNRKFEDLEKFLISKTNCPEESVNEIRFALRNFKKQFILKWNKCDRHKSRFLLAENCWLRTECNFKLYSTTKCGRPSKTFDESSEQTKRRKTATLRDSYSAKELAYAAQMKFRSSGKLLEAKHVQKVTRLDECLLNRPSTALSPSKLTPVQALSLMMEAQLSKKQYNIIRNYAKDVFPSYKFVQKEKSTCYPEGTLCTEVKAEVPLQSLLNHTTCRLLQVQEEVISSLEPTNKYTLISKWGFDGSSSHTQYMQKFSSDEYDDKYMFLASLVPLRLTSEAAGKTLVVWKNPRPSSPRFCRPIKLQYKKENAELCKTEKNNIDEQIDNLVDTKIFINEKEYSITHKPIFTMVDGKICNALSDTRSTLRCYLCDATSKDFNDIRKMMERPIKKEYLSFGISVLHAWIRMFECLLHIAYKLPVKQWRVTKETEDQIENNKKRIQKEFKSTMSLIVDKPKPGYGNTNDGNVARKFFQNSELSAAITGISKELIQKFYIILQTISSGFNIDTNKFNRYCLNTAELYISLYPWYPMTTSVHKILIHGEEIISNALLPIGCFSEEAQEARNKDFKVYRERFSRKTSREDNMKDVFNRLLISSDPLITCVRSPTILDRKAFDPEVVDMLLEESIF